MQIQQRTGQISIYSGMGTSEALVEETKTILERNLDPHLNVVTTFEDPVSIRDHDISVMVLPGGHAYQINKGLEDRLDSKLSTTSVIAICASAILGTEHKIVQQRGNEYGLGTVDFFVPKKTKWEPLKGICFAPMIPARSEVDHAYMVPIKWKFKNGTDCELSAFYLNGPCFLNVCRDSQKIIGRYQYKREDRPGKHDIDIPACAVELKEEGRTSIFVGVHFEANFKDKDVLSSQNMEYVRPEKLAEYQSQSELCFRDVMERVDLPLKPLIKED